MDLLEELAQRLNQLHRPQPSLCLLNAIPLIGTAHRHSPDSLEPSVECAKNVPNIIGRAVRWGDENYPKR
jgi:hypothetical protein